LLAVVGGGVSERGHLHLGSFPHRAVLRSRAGTVVEAPT
jgi:hypothetical protein